MNPYSSVEGGGVGGWTREKCQGLSEELTAPRTPSFYLTMSKEPTLSRTLLIMLFMYRK